jgi:hypothetical protein
MNKQNHSKSFVINVCVVLEGVCEISIGFSIGVNSICGSQDDYGQITCPDFGSFGLQLSIEKADDQVSSFFVILDIIFLSEF